MGDKCSVAVPAMGDKCSVAEFFGTTVMVTCPGEGAVETVLSNS